MTGPRIPTSLERKVGREPAGEDQLEAMRAAAWHRQGGITLRPEEVTNEWLRQGLVNEAEARWGKRRDAA